MDVIYSWVSSSKNGDMTEYNGGIFIHEYNVSERLSEGINLDIFFSHIGARFAFIFIRLRALCQQKQWLIQRFFFNFIGV